MKWLGQLGGERERERGKGRGGERGEGRERERERERERGRERKRGERGEDTGIWFRLTVDHSLDLVVHMGICLRVLYQYWVQLL